jgi:hypothetical protein
MLSTVGKFIGIVFAAAHCQPTFSQSPEVVKGRIEIVATSAIASGVRDGPKEQALFSGIQGIAKLPNGELRVLGYSKNPKSGLRKISASGEVSTVTATGWEVQETRFQTSTSDHETGAFYFLRSRITNDPFVKIVKIDSAGVGSVISGAPGTPFDQLPLSDSPSNYVRLAGDERQGFWVLNQAEGLIFWLRKNQKLVKIDTKLILDIGSAKSLKQLAPAGLGQVWVSGYGSKIYKIDQSGKLLLTLDQRNPLAKDDTRSQSNDYDLSNIDRLVPLPDGLVVSLSRDTGLVRLISSQGKILKQKHLCEINSDSACVPSKLLQGKMGTVEYITAISANRWLVSDTDRIYQLDDVFDSSKPPALIAGRQTTCLDKSDNLLQSHVRTNGVIPCMASFKDVGKFSNDRFVLDPRSPKGQTYNWLLSKQGARTASTFQINTPVTPTTKVNEKTIGTLSRFANFTSELLMGPIEVIAIDLNVVDSTIKSAGSRGVFSRNLETGTRKILARPKQFPYDKSKWRRNIEPQLRIAKLDDKRIAISDDANNTIHALNIETGQLKLLVGKRGNGQIKDGTSSQARLSSPIWIANDSNGAVLMQDSNSAWVRQVFPDGRIESIARFEIATGRADSCNRGSYSVRHINRDSNGRLWAAFDDGQIFLQTGKSLVNVAGTPDAGVTSGGPLPGTFGSIQAMVPGLSGDMFIVSKDAIARIEIDSVTEPSVTASAINPFLPKPCG